MLLLLLSLLLLLLVNSGLPVISQLNPDKHSKHHTTALSEAQLGRECDSFSKSVQIQEHEKAKFFFFFTCTVNCCFIEYQGKKNVLVDVETRRHT